MANNYPILQHHYYSNPAFCQQSEFVNISSKSPPRALSPQRSLRQSPVGAHSPGELQEVPVTINGGTKLTTSNGRYVCYGDNNVNISTLSPKQDNDEDFEEQEFYEEMTVDDNGLVKKKKVVVVSNHLDVKNGNGQSYRYVRVPDNNVNVNNNFQSRQNVPANRRSYAQMSYTDDDIVNSNSTLQKNRYEYIPMKGREIRRSKSFTSPPKRKQYDVEEVPVGNGKVHRYAIIPMEDETELCDNSVLSQSPQKLLRQEHYEVIQDNGRYEYLPLPYQKCEEEQRIVQSQPVHNSSPHRQNNGTNQSNPPSLRRVTSPASVRKGGNAVATQKLHELLSTPKKTSQRSSSASHTPQGMSPVHQTLSYLPQLVPVTKSPFITSLSPLNNNKPLRKAPKAQQKLNYALSTRQMTKDQRHTAIVTPICSSPVQSETTYSTRSESWMNVSIHKKPVHATLAAAALMMVICGGLASGLCFYMISVMGRLYFLDFGIVSGFACFVLGLLGFRSRNYYYWLPNRNYMSGYIILTLFSLLTCVGLLVLLFMQPKPGTPLADMTSGAVCGISVLSLVLASAGVISSYCCRFPPPDNRVEHCAQGFIV
ncbi:uncharacterized protein LOC108738691 [Agrilus planipennis]|uniref:Uncharacterized protein LOC108738691 n=1 Tax=Agrilus planipennis TaxID=224129 RepID=A0A1W4X5W6_AGRPL|nr:uncharacterized protein LOC108738691 [Agrilus planipennis]